MRLGLGSDKYHPWMKQSQRLTAPGASLDMLKHKWQKVFENGWEHESEVHWVVR